MLRPVHFNLFFFVAFLLLFCSCKNSGFNVKAFDPLSNYNEKRSDSLYTLKADLDDAVLNGIEIPSKKQTDNGYFVFTFQVKNNSSDIKKYYYKIFYENTSYKFNDTSKYAYENFYGSWADGRYTFKATKILSPGDEITVRDSFKIVGNPRNETKYFGADPEKYIAIDDSIKAKMNFVRSVPGWMKTCTEKAKELGTTLDEQIYLNALWGINYEKQRMKDINNRWKRNPRMGSYEFMLVVTSPEDIGKIPMRIRDMQKTDSAGQFLNPFGYFLLGAGKDLTNTFVLLSEKKLKVSSQLDLGSGIYVDKLGINKSTFSLESLNTSCNNSPELYKKAQFTQYFHNIDKNFTVYNIPEIRDVTGENFSKAEYKELETKYSDKKTRTELFVSTSDYPCRTVMSDNANKKLLMTVPASEEGKLKKEHVGLSSRVGFTYGKFRAKIKFPKMLSKDNVWNGITNAFWLLFQEDAEWNFRRDCNAEVAYIPKSAPNNEESVKQSKKSLSYSEIDFEIVKESQYWPPSSYKDSKSIYKTDNGLNDNIMVACTNWDMACHEPKKFSFGAHEFMIDSSNYLFHRWNFFYRALSTKIPVKHGEIFDKPYYYFEIEWLPEKIVWKIGTEKDKLHTICVMDKSITSIPNNQMILMFTQEWHNEEWWPTAPYKQNFIPFPKKDIIGEILEIEIE
jgi:hypothetical protein